MRNLTNIFIDSRYSTSCRSEVATIVMMVPISQQQKKTQSKTYKKKHKQEMDSIFASYNSEIPAKKEKKVAPTSIKVMHIMISRSVQAPFQSPSNQDLMV